MDAQVLRLGLGGERAGEGALGLRDALDVEVVEVGREQVLRVVAEVDVEVLVVAASGRVLLLVAAALGLLLSVEVLLPAPRSVGRGPVRVLLEDLGRLLAEEPVVVGAVREHLQERGRGK